MTVSRVAYVCNDGGIPLYGSAGSSIHIREYITSLSNCGVEPLVLYRPGTGQSGQNSIPAKEVQLPTTPLAHGYLNKVFDLESIAKNFELSFALRRIPDDIDVIHERYSLYSYKGARFARNRNIPFVLEVNSPLIYEANEYGGGLQRPRVAERAEREACQDATKILAVSRELKDYFSKYVDEEKITVVPNGVNPDQFNPDTPARTPDDRFTIGFVGSFKDWHGVSNLVQAGKQLSDLRDSIRFLLVGSGPLYEDLQKEISQSGLDDFFELPGSVPHSEIPGYLSSMDVAVAPYPDLSFFYYSPVKLFEYMSMALPTICSAIGQIERIIDDGENGYLIPSGAVDALVEEVRDVLNLSRNQPNELDKTGRRARERILDEYTWTQNAQRILNVYKSGINEQS
ncbi:glycosyl transferase family 1 [Haloarcula hispanica N601]|nr:glycosyltransferase family 4 protein [Haloarcula hispanica]AHB66468.1 glycosyl transferase family 1 [Haloarcula hispanica N601]